MTHLVPPGRKEGAIAPSGTRKKEKPGVHILRRHSFWISGSGKKRGNGGIVTSRAMMEGGELAPALGHNQVTQGDGGKREGTICVGFRKKKGFELSSPRGKEEKRGGGKDVCAIREKRIPGRRNPPIPKGRRNLSTMKRGGRGIHAIGVWENHLIPKGKKKRGKGRSGARLKKEEYQSVACKKRTGLGSPPGGKKGRSGGSRRRKKEKEPAALHNHRKKGGGGVTLLERKKEEKNVVNGGVDSFLSDNHT